jgi:hypothetical protein
MVFVPGAVFGGFGGCFGGFFGGGFGGVREEELGAAGEGPAVVAGDADGELQAFEGAQAGADGVGAVAGGGDEIGGADGATGEMKDDVARQGAPLEGADQHALVRREHLAYLLGAHRDLQFDLSIYLCDYSDW